MSAPLDTGAPGAPLLRYGITAALDAAEAAWAPFWALALGPAGGTDHDAEEARENATEAAYTSLTHGGVDEDIAIVLARALCGLGNRRAATMAGAAVETGE